MDDSSVYDPEKDGDLIEYLQTHNGISAFPLFRGYQHFKQLWDRGLFVPNRSLIRLMWNVIRDDEYFLVRGEFEIEGVSDLPAHAGRAGVYDPRKLLDKKDCPPWEASHLNPEFIWKK